MEMIWSLKGFPAKRSRASDLVMTRRSNFCFCLTIFWTSVSIGLSLVVVVVVGGGDENGDCDIGVNDKVEE